jgi:hypothetical protein
MFKDSAAGHVRDRRAPLRTGAEQWRPIARCDECHARPATIGVAKFCSLQPNLQQGRMPFTNHMRLTRDWLSDLPDCGLVLSV